MNSRLRHSLLALTAATLWPLSALAGDVALKGQIEKWEKHFNAGDGAGVAALYTEDAQLLPPDADFVKGRAAIQAYWQGAIDQAAGENSLNTVEMLEYGDVVVESGTWLEHDGLNGKYLVVWKKTPSGWLIQRDIWNVSPGDEGSK